MIFKKFDWVKLTIEELDSPKGNWYFLWLDRFFKKRKKVCIPFAYINDFWATKIGKDVSTEVNFILYHEEPKDLIIQRKKQ